MEPISGMTSGPAYPAAPAGGKEPPEVRRPGEEARPREPVMDKYVPERKEGEEERCIGSTDRVDREIEQLKKRRAELEQRLNAETGEGKRRDLERRLAQVERELKQKDNDAYRRRHMQVTRA